MNPKWLMGIVLASLIFSVWSGVIEGTYVSANTTTTLNSLMNLQVLTWADPANIAISSFVVGSTIIGALWKMFWWDYAQFNGDLIIFRYIGIAVSIGIAFTIALTIISRK